MGPIGRSVHIDPLADLLRQFLGRRRILTMHHHDTHLAGAAIACCYHLGDLPDRLLH